MKRLRKRICGAGILFLMTILALGTMVSFAEEKSTSYKLTIQKIFASGTPAGAKDVTYTFRVEAEVKGQKEPVEQTVRITGEGSEVISFGNAFKISVIEQTDDGGFHDDTGNEWDVINTYCESSMHVGASQATVNISRDGGMIKVTRPVDVPTVTFRLTGKPFHSGNGTISIPGGTDQTVAAGGTAEWTNLPQGEYTITKLRSADGFSVLVGERSFYVDAPDPTNPKAPDPVGIVHINGNDSKISITAPRVDDDTPKKTHHYIISGPVTREIDVLSGDTGVVEHLTEGDYTIRVSRTYNGISGYTVTLPQTTSQSKYAYGTAISTTSTPARKYITVGGDYIDNLKYGPLYAGNTVLKNATYYFHFGVLNPDDPSKVKLWTMTNAVTGQSQNNPVSLTGMDIVKKPYNNRLYIGTKNVSNSSATKFKVSWTEYTIAEPSDKTILTPNPNGDVITIDDRGWFTIKKPADTSDPRSGEVTYDYTITDSNGKAITGFTVDAKDASGDPVNVTVDGSTVTLKAGQSVTISGLHAGNFRIYEEATPAPMMGFNVTLNDTEKRVTAPRESIDIEILGERTVEISRPGNETDDGGRLYTYEIYKSGETEPIRKVTLKSGETKTVAEATDGTKLPAGKYRIEAVDDQIVGFDVTYSDSSSLTSDYIKNASVKFTNSFGIVNASYHVIHEYYLKNADGSYTFEGVSPVYTKNCDQTLQTHPDNICAHHSSEVHQLDVYNGNTYQHIEDGGDAYGKIVSWDTGGEQKTVPVDSNDQTPGDNYQFLKNGTGYSGADENGHVKHEYAYVPLENMDHAKALPHEETDGSAAQLIILRYCRDDTPKEHGKYNIIHEYYQRTDHGDVWEGSSNLSTVDIGRLTSENRYHTYDANGVTPILRFTPTKDNTAKVEYPYVYDSAAYGRIISSDSIAAGKPGDLGGGKVYLMDSTMNNVQATEAGDQIIILRYYRGGGYKVVHEYYYREAADFEGSTGETGEESGSDAGGDSSGTGGESDSGAGAEGTRTVYSENNLQQNGENTAADQNTVSGNNQLGTTDSIGSTLSDTTDIIGDILPDTTNVIGNISPDAVILSTTPPREGTGNGADMAQSGENSVSSNNPPVTAQSPENTISGNNLPDTGSADISQSGNEIAETAEENAELEAYGIMALDEGSGEENNFNGTLTDEAGFVYAFEGKRDIASYSADLESRHNAGGVRKENLFQPAGDEQHLYAFKDAVYGYMDGSGAYRVAPFMTGVTATSNEDEIIILRYIRGEGVEEPEQPTPPETPSGGGGSNPPPEDPEIPEIPDLPTELPDPNDPDSPDRITILEDGVPKTYVKVWDFDNQEWIYIPEEEVPLWKTSPQTADGNMPGFWFVLAAGSAGGIILLKSQTKKKR